MQRFFEGVLGESLTIHDGADSPDRLVTDWSLSNNEQLVSHTEECSTVTLTVDQ
jgi:hypothetical protein